MGTHALDMTHEADGINSRKEWLWQPCVDY
jgi:hypothetical protein